MMHKGATRKLLVIIAIKLKSLQIKFVINLQMPDQNAQLFQGPAVHYGGHSIS